MTITFMIKNGDILHSSSTGRPLTVADGPKFDQDVRETLDNEVQPDGTGAGLDGVITFIGDVFSIRAEIARRVNDAFAAYKQTQNVIQRFDRTPAERFSRVVQVTTLPLRDSQTGNISQTAYAYRVDVLSDAARSKPATVTGTLTR